MRQGWAEILLFVLTGLVAVGGLLVTVARDEAPAVLETPVVQAEIEEEAVGGRAPIVADKPLVEDWPGAQASVQGLVLGSIGSKLFIQSGIHTLEVSYQGPARPREGERVMMVLVREPDKSLRAVNLGRVSVATRDSVARVERWRETNGALEPNPEALALWIREFNPRVKESKADRLARLLLKHAKKQRLDPAMFVALVATESAFNERAVSSAGARGLGQLMPGTARGLGVRNSFDAEQNLGGSSRYLRQMLDSGITRGQERLALAAYNAGPGNVSRYGGVPPFPETRHYIRVVQKRQQGLQRYFALK